VQTSPRTSPSPDHRVWARPGDRLLIHGHRVGEPERDAEILEARGEDRGPPFLVCWQDDGHVSLVFPGSDASIEHFTHPRARVKGARSATRKRKST